MNKLALALIVALAAASLILAGDIVWIESMIEELER